MHKAVDIVLLPPPVVINRAISFNQQLGPDGGIILHPESCLPHISLAMACISSKDVETVGQKLEQVLQTFTPVSLEIPEISARPETSGHYTYSYEIEASEQLQSLHETVMDILLPYHLPEAVRPETLFTREWKQSSLDWIENYAQRQSREHFWPHITLGVGQIEAFPSVPEAFSADRLALCHLGNHCTCRQILWEGLLQQK